MPDIEIRALDCDLTPSEIIEKATTLAEHVTEIATLEEQKKSSASSFKEQIESKKTLIVDISRQIRIRKEVRGVECEIRRDYLNGVVRVFRNDTAELVSTRRMSVDERQLALGDPAPSTKQAETLIGRVAKQAEERDEAQMADTPEEAEEVRNARIEAEAADEPPGSADEKLAF
jgi:hypothetical protein